MKRLVVWTFVCVFLIGAECMELMEEMEANELQHRYRTPEKLETTPPKVEIIYPQNMATVPPGSYVTIKVHAWDESGIRKVVFKISGARTITYADYDPPYEYVWKTPERKGPYIQVGHSIEVTAYDNYGNTRSVRIHVNVGRP